MNFYDASATTIFFIFFCILKGQCTTGYTKNRYIAVKNSDSVRKYEGAFQRRIHKRYTRRKTPSSYPLYGFLILDEVDFHTPILRSAGFRIITGNRLFGAGTGRV